MFFASEIVLLGTYEISSFSALVIASALSTVVSRAYYGAVPAFPIPAYTIVNALAISLPGQGAAYARSPAAPLACPLPVPVCDSNGNCQ